MALSSDTASHVDSTGHVVSVLRPRRRYPTSLLHGGRAARPPRAERSGFVASADPMLRPRSLMK